MGKSSTDSSPPSQLTPASPWRRIAAFGVDYCVFILPLLGVLGLVGWALRSLNMDPFSDNAWQNHGIVILALTVPAVLYFALSEASRFQATLGKRLMRLSVLDLTGKRATLKQTTIRAGVKFLPWEYFHAILWHWEGWPTNPAPITSLQIVAMTVGWIVMVWFVVSLFFGSRRAPYDLASSTIVATNARLGANESEAIE